LQARYYSISSSPRENAMRVSVTSVVVDYTIGERNIKGVCTNFLKDKPVLDGEQVVNQSRQSIDHVCRRRPCRSSSASRRFDCRTAPTFPSS